jgi:hypothetical protein
VNTVSRQQALATAERLLNTDVVLAAVPGTDAASLASGLAGTALLHARLACTDPAFAAAAIRHWTAAATHASRHGGSAGIYHTPGGLAALANHRTGIPARSGLSASRSRMRRAVAACPAGRRTSPATSWTAAPCGQFRAARTHGVTERPASAGRWHWPAARSEIPSSPEQQRQRSRLSPAPHPALGRGRPSAVPRARRSPSMRVSQPDGHGRPCGGGDPRRIQSRAQVCLPAPGQGHRERRTWPADRRRRSRSRPR